MTDREAAELVNLVTTIRSEVAHLKADFEKLESDVEESVRELKQSQTESAVNNARNVGIALGIVGFISIIGTIASIWAALR